jgi:hypothetical protein
MFTRIVTVILVAMAMSLLGSFQGAKADVMVPNGVLLSSDSLWGEVAGGAKGHGGHSGRGGSAGRGGSGGSSGGGASGMSGQ